MRVVTTPIALDELRSMAERSFGVMVEAVVDVERRVMAVDAELNADEEACLLAEGSFQQSLRGINLDPEMPMEDWVEFGSMINLRPSQGNRSRGVDNPDTRSSIRDVVDALVAR